MYDFIIVTVHDCRHHLFENQRGLAFVEMMFDNDLIKKFTSVAKLAYNIKTSFVFVKFINL